MQVSNAVPHMYLAQPSGSRQGFFGKREHLLRWLTVDYLKQKLRFLVQFPGAGCAMNPRNLLREGLLKMFRALSITGRSLQMIKSSFMHRQRRSLGKVQACCTDLISTKSSQNYLDRCRQFMDPDNILHDLPGTKEIAQLFARLACNSHTICDEDDQAIGWSQLTTDPNQPLPDLLFS